MVERLRRYDGVDSFRIVAAILIVAIHTYPLFFYSVTINFILVHILFRIAVPFFLMTTGYFLIPKLFHQKNAGIQPIKSFLIRTLVLYGIACAIYIPIGIYAGFYSEGNVIFLLLRNILFNGTFYHLWYLPAAILGVLVIYGLSRILSIRGVTIVTIVLYILCLLGDSYYGFTTDSRFLSSLFDEMFTVFSFTRNGLLYAPIFLMLGCVLANNKAKLETVKTRTLIVGFVIFYSLMLGEGLLIWYFGLSRHDSSYILLIPTMLFLFLLLYRKKGERSVFFRDTSLWIYILHPLIMILIRGVASFLEIQFIVFNTLLFFLLTCIFSFIAAGILSYLTNYYAKSNSLYTKDRAWVEIDGKALKQNVEQLRKLLPTSCELMPAIKANAYGHGAGLMGRMCNELHIQHFCVATVLEGVELRKARVKGTILVLGYTHPKQFHLLHRYKLQQTVVDLDYAVLLSTYGKKIHVHIAVDTGMKRLGESSEFANRFMQMAQLKNIIIEGIFSHLSGQSDTFSKIQMKRLDELVSELKKQGVHLPKIHMQSSYGVFVCPDSPYDYARVGIVLYGAMEGQNEEGRNFKPVLTLKARVSTIKDVKKGEAVGYGNAFFAPENITIAVLTIGYADGVKRELSNGVGSVLLAGKRAKIVGLICMDQMMVDISHIEGVKQGDEAILIGSSGEESITAVEMANLINTIPNDILSSLTTRITRVLK